jgi:hypothetical protein
MPPVLRRPAQKETARPDDNAFYCKRPTRDETKLRVALVSRVMFYFCS